MLMQQRLPGRGRARRQRGAASLIVVMILFFVISMVAAYTNRNLIFEQKTSVNQSRSTRALEAADAGVDWALTLLNTGRITDACVTSANAADMTFRQRYLNIDPANGNITPRKRADGVTDLYPTCVYDGAAWTCSCPTDGDAVMAAPAGNDVYPAFRVRFRRVCALPTAADTACGTPVQPGVVHIDVNACTSPTDDCLRFSPAPTALPGEGRVTVHVTAALRSALPSTPSAALTIRGTVTADAGGSDLSVTNAEAAGTGISIQSGGDVLGSVTPVGKPGTPPDRSLFKLDPTLSAASMTADRFFINVFGLWRNTFREQPAAIEVNCAVSCTAATLRSKIALNPGRVFWVIGDLDFDSAGDIGTAADPVMINVTGSVTFTSPVNVYGAIYSQAPTWALSGGGLITGGAFAEGNINDAAAATTGIVFNTDILTRLRTQTGSFVRVPGTWRDFDT